MASTKRVEAVLRDGVQKLYDVTKAAAQQPETGVDKSEMVVRFMVLEAIRMFNRLTSRQPKVIYVPRSVESALEIDRGMNLGQHRGDVGPLREADLLFGCQPVWDSDDFRVE